jgi:DNA uptake protein ComE-like DNA-binding protein
MRLSTLSGSLVALAFVCATMLAVGCDTRVASSKDPDIRAQDEKIERDVAKATEKAKPTIQEAGRELRAGAKVAAEEAKAAAKGAREGWEHGTRSKVDINSATESDLISLPGISHHDARRIISRRPYNDSHDLVRKGVLTEDNFVKIRDEVTASKT